MKFLDNIRVSEDTGTLKKQILMMCTIFFLGIVMGTFSKFLDGELPTWLYRIDRFLDLHNFLGGFAPWIIIALGIAVYSHTPIRASIHVFVFFVGMVSSYYIYGNFVLGFFPKNYAMIWFMLTLISPVLAFICWYAKGKGVIAFLISSSIIGIIMNTAFAYGMFYIDIYSWLNVLMLLFGFVILYQSPKETIATIGMGAIFAILIEIILPFRIW